MAALEADPGCGAALHLYGRIALARGLADDALRVALRLAVAAPQRADAKRLLAECLPVGSRCWVGWGGGCRYQPKLNRTQCNRARRRAWPML